MTRVVSSAMNAEQLNIDENNVAVNIAYYAIINY